MSGSASFICLRVSKALNLESETPRNEPPATSLARQRSGQCVVRVIDSATSARRGMLAEDTWLHSPSRIAAEERRAVTHGPSRAARRWTRCRVSESAQRARHTFETPFWRRVD